MRREAQTTATRRGVSLIELIAVIVILGVAMPPMMMTLGESQRRRASPVLADTARWLASERLEEILADRFSLERGLEFVAPENYPSESPVAGFNAFSRRVLIEERGTDLQPGGKGAVLVTVEVSWTDPALGLRTTSLASLFAETRP